jgi:hypothetical protein
MCASVHSTFRSRCIAALDEFPTTVETIFALFPGLPELPCSSWYPLLAGRVGVEVPLLLPERLSLLLWGPSPDTAIAAVIIAFELFPFRLNEESLSAVLMTLLGLGAIFLLLLPSDKRGMIVPVTAGWLVCGGDGEDLATVESVWEIWDEDELEICEWLLFDGFVASCKWLWLFCRWWWCVSWWWWCLFWLDALWVKAVCSNG